MSPPSKESGPSGLRVLVVEDEFLVADHVAMILEDLGYEVIGPVPTIEDALAAIECEALDGALLDANLDGLSSAPVADALDALAVPFVVATGYGNLKLTAAILENAPRVAKPFGQTDLARTLSSAFAR